MNEQKMFLMGYLGATIVFYWRVNAQFKKIANRKDGGENRD